MEKKNLSLEIPLSQVRDFCISEMRSRISRERLHPQAIPSDELIVEYFDEYFEEFREQLCENIKREIDHSLLQNAFRGLGLFESLDVAVALMDNHLRGKEQKDDSLLTKAKLMDELVNLAKAL